MYRFDEYRPGRIYTIGKEVWNIARDTVRGEIVWTLERESRPTLQYVVEQWQDIDSCIVVVRSTTTREPMLNIYIVIAPCLELNSW